MDVVEFAKASNVNSIYWVDDEHANEEEIDISILAGELASSIEADESNTKSDLKKALEKELPDKKSLIRKFFKNPENSETLNELLNEVDDPRSLLEFSIGHYEGIPKDELIKNIDSYLSDSSSYSKVSFTDWNRNKDDILNALNSENRALIFLDLKNTKESNVGSDAGIEVISNLSGHHNKDNALIVIFTSSVSPEEEINKSRIFTDEYYGKSSFPVFMLSKRRDTSETSLYLSSILKRVLLTVSYTELRTAILDLYTDSVNQTFTELRTMTAEEMIYKLAKGSENEGISIIESLLRVIDSVTKSTLQKRISVNSSVSSIVKKCLSLDSDIERCNEIEDEFISNFQKNEKYENIDAVNLMHSPISVGDVFEITHDGLKGEYLLVGNFCFTSLRGKGDRKNRSAMLFPITQKKPTHENFFDLKMYKESTGQASVFVDFTDPLVIDFFYLDLCWVAPDGKADESINVENLDKALNEAPIIKAQRNRLSQMKSMIEGEEKILEERTSGLKNIVRIARLSREHALLVVHEYTRKLSLLPEEVDFE